MSAPIVIIGSGFAAYQLVKMLRKQSQDCPITVITANGGEEYSKPDLSHVFTRSQLASDLVKMSGEAFAQSMNINLMTFTQVDSIDPANHSVLINGKPLTYKKLVLATGASPFIPDVKGSAVDKLITLNSLDEYLRAQERLSSAKSVMVVGAGLIGTEIAMDLASTGRRVVLTDRMDRVMTGLLPDFISAQLLQVLTRQSVRIELGTEVVALESLANGVEVVLGNGQSYQVDVVICATGLKSNTTLASEAGLNVNRGVVANKQLQTSSPDIYTLGDCTEIEGHVLPFLQPIMLSASVLAKTLVGQQAELKIPSMLVKIKTPLLPIQLSGITGHENLAWQVDASAAGMVAKAFNDQEKLVGVVATAQRTSELFPLLRQLPVVL